MIEDRGAFAARRDIDLTKIEDAIRPAVHRALGRYGHREGWYAPILTAAQRVFRQFYVERHSTGTPKGIHGPLDAFMTALKASLEHTKPPTDTTEATITRWVSTSAVNAGTLAGTDSPDEELEWVTMHDSRVRDSHKAVDGTRRAPGAPFTVGGVKLHFPGEPVGDPEVWIGCRCVLRPVAKEAAMVAAGSTVAEKKNKSAVIVALPHANDPVHQMGPEPAHVTLVFLGDAANVDAQQVNDVLAQRAQDMKPFSDNVSGRAQLGADKAEVLLLDGEHLTGIRSDLLQQEPIAQPFELADQFPNFVPHLTLGYPGDGSTDSTSPESVAFDRLALWHGDNQTEYPLGGAMTASVPADVTSETGLIPWHGVLAPEGVFSGDKRRFAAGSLRNRPLPMPLTWQKVGQEQHKGRVTVGMIDALERDETTGLMRASGRFRASPEADEVIGLIADFGQFGVSVDIDDAAFEVDEADGNAVTFSDARICSACIVDIPAFSEAFVALGAWGENDGTPPGETNVPPSDAGATAGLTDEFGRGPGWVTNPADTKRLHDYWTVPGQPGYAKIAWGTGGDFNRCRVEIGQEIGESDPAKLRFINAQCAQWHKDALGYWPSTHKKLLGGHAADAVSLVASAPKWTPPAEWFADPHLDQPVGVVVEDTPHGKRCYGYIAYFDSCHAGFPGVCVKAPRSGSEYSRFLQSTRNTTDGSLAVGVLSFGGGHADRRLGMVAAMAHYDDVATAVAEVNVGENSIGIWFAGWILPTVNDDTLEQFTARPLSGDWRDDPRTGQLEMIAACSVNTPGFARPAAAVQNGRQVSLVAAGVIQGDVASHIDYATLAAHVVAHQERQERIDMLAVWERTQRLAALPDVIE